jgi:hypothetical protein
VRFRRERGALFVIGRVVAPGAAATTIGRVVFVKKGREDDPLLVEHELVHVRQYRTRGLVGFLVPYLWRYLRLRLQGWPHWAAYRRLPHEAEADWEARRRLGIGVPGRGGPASLQP